MPWWDGFGVGEGGKGSAGLFWPQVPGSPNNYPSCALLSQGGQHPDSFTEQNTDASLGRKRTLTDELESQRGHAVKQADSFLRVLGQCCSWGLYKCPAPVTVSAVTPLSGQSFQCAAFLVLFFLHLHFPLLPHGH